MPTIEFLGNALGPQVNALAPDGGRLLDVCDEVQAPVAFSCRSSNCGTCRVDVVAGAALLHPPELEELVVLDAFDAAPSERLACQVMARPGSGLIQLRWIHG